jgi:hypothetical protein
MSITCGNDSYEARQQQTAMAIAGVQLAQKRSRPQSDGLAETAAVWSIAAREFRLLSSEHYGEPGTIRMAGDGGAHGPWRGFCA